PLPYLHSFPTRRSSDLLGALQRGPSVAPVVAPESTQPARLNEQTPTETDHSTVKGPATPSERTPATPAVRSTPAPQPDWTPRPTDRKSTRLNSSHVAIS